MLKIFVRQQSEICNNFHIIPVFHHTCVTCSELPSRLHVPWIRQRKQILWRQDPYFIVLIISLISNKTIFFLTRACAKNVEKSHTFSGMGCLKIFWVNSKKANVGQTERLTELFLDLQQKISDLDTEIPTRDECL